MYRLLLHVSLYYLLCASAFGNDIYGRAREPVARKPQTQGSQYNDRYACSAPIKLTEQIERQSVNALKEQHVLMSTIGANYLRSLNTDIVIVTLVGRARSGKSFTANTLLGLNHSTGFRVGHGMVGETAGAQLWCGQNVLTQQVRQAVAEKLRGIQANGAKTETLAANAGIDIADQKPSTFTGAPFEGGVGAASTPQVLLVDTEGVNLGSQHNDGITMLFAAATSNILIYHVSEQVNSDDVKRLGAIKEFIMHLHSQGALDPDMSTAAENDDTKGIVPQRTIKLPALFWVVQKFSQILSDGTLASMDELPNRASADSLIYTSFLREDLNPSNDKNIALHNETVRAIRKAFVGQHAFVAPSAMTEKVRHASKLPDAAKEDISPMYLRSMDELRAAIVDHIAEQHVRGLRPLTWYSSTGGWATGSEFATIATNSLYAAANGDSSFVASAVVEYIARDIVAKAFDATNELFSRIVLPQSDDEIEKTSKDISQRQTAALDMNITHCLVSSTRDALLQSFSDHILGNRELLRGRNSKAQQQGIELALQTATNYMNKNCTRKDRYNGCKFNSIEEFTDHAKKTVVIFRKLAPWRCDMLLRQESHLVELINARRDAVRASILPALKFSYATRFILYTLCWFALAIIAMVYTYTMNVKVARYFVNICVLMSILCFIPFALMLLSAMEYLWDYLDEIIDNIVQENSLLGVIIVLLPFRVVVVSSICTVALATSIYFYYRKRLGWDLWTPFSYINIFRWSGTNNVGSDKCQKVVGANAPIASTSLPTISAVQMPPSSLVTPVESILQSPSRENDVALIRRFGDTKE